MKNSICLILGFLSFIPISLSAQDDITNAARNADIAAAKAAQSARLAAESAEKAIKMAREAAESAGIDLRDLDTFESNPEPDFDPGDTLISPPPIVDQIPVNLKPGLMQEAPRVEVREIDDFDTPVVEQRPVYHDSVSNEDYYAAEIPSAKAFAAAKEPVIIDDCCDHGLEFHGSFQYGYLADLNNNGDKLSYPTTANRKESLGRIGLEVDDWWHATVSKKFTLSNGNWGKATLTYGSVNSGLDARDFILFGGRSAKTTGLLEAYIELGILEDCDASIWAGQRNYGRRLYSELTDFYFTDYSGTGFGLENLSVGCGHFDIAYLTSDFSKEGWPGRFNDNDTSIPYNGGVFDTEELLHSFHIGYRTGNWDLGVMAKYYPDNNSTVNESRGVTDTGVEATVAYHQDSFYGMAEGCSHYVFQVGSGLSSGPGLGANFNTNNIFRLGAVPVDFIDRQSDDISYRAASYGCFEFNDCIKVLPHVLVQVDDALIDRTLASGVLRGVVSLSDCISLVAETGLEYVDLDDGIANDGYQYKVSIAPTVTFCSGFGETTSVSLIAAHIDGDTERGYNASQTVVGVQAGVKW